MSPRTRSECARATNHPAGPDLSPSGLKDTAAHGELDTDRRQCSPGARPPAGLEASTRAADPGQEGD